MPAAADLSRVLKAVAESLATPEDVDESLLGITRAAHDAIPGVDHASISMLRPGGRIETIAPTDDLVARSDDLQYELGEGPCVEAVRTQDDVVAVDVATDERWPHYGPRVAELGVVSQLALRLHTNGVTLGALNLYSNGEGPFDAASREMADLFATAAATALGLSRAVTTLNEAVTTRTSIGTAIGIVMERFDLDQEGAFAFMVRVSQTGNIKLRLVAEQIVEEASLKARGKG